MTDGVSTALILLAVALSEGIRLTPDGSIVVRRVLFGGWRRVEPLALGRGFTLPGAPTPFVLALVALPSVVPPSGIRRATTRLRARLRRARVSVALLRALGAVSLLVLVLGVPLATARSGWWGLAVSLATMLALALAQSVVLYAATRRAGGSRGRSAKNAIRVLWPFTTPRGAELLLDQVIDGTPPLVVARALLVPAAFADAVRPLAYDVLHARAEADGELLRALCGVEALEGIVSARPAEADRYCPRCASGFQPGIAECSECEAVPLVG